MIRAGTYREYVDFQQPSTAQYASGQPNPWGSPTTLLSSVPASIEVTGGAEQRRGEGIESTNQYRIECRWSSDLESLTPGDRVVTDKHGTLEVASIARQWSGGNEIAVINCGKTTS